MTTDEVLEQFGEVPLYFSHYYNFVFIFKSKLQEGGERVYLQLGGNMEKVSAMVVDAEEPLTLEEMTEHDFAYIKNKDNRVIWKNGKPKGD